MYSICHKHRSVTTWGCRECRRERLQEVARESAQRFWEDLKASHDQAPKITAE